MKTKAYMAWIKDADNWYWLQKLHRIKPITGPCELKIRLPKIRGDASNRIKAAEDWLVSRGITGDDKNNRKVSVEIDPQLQRWECWLQISPVEEYHGRKDFSDSIDEAYRVIRERVASGGPSWTPKPWKPK